MKTIEQIEANIENAKTILEDLKSEKGSWKTGLMILKIENEIATLEWVLSES